MSFQSMLGNRLDDYPLHHCPPAAPERITACLPDIPPSFERKQHTTQQTKREPRPSWQIVSRRPSHCCNWFPEPPAALSDVVKPTTSPRWNAYALMSALGRSLWQPHCIPTIHFQPCRSRQRRLKITFKYKSQQNHLTKSAINCIINYRKQCCEQMPLSDSFCS